MKQASTSLRRIPTAPDNRQLKCLGESDPRAAMDPSERVWRECGLLAAVLAGDERAWQTWYDESFEALYVYVHWRCGGNRDRTDEIVQETWLTAVRRIASFQPERGSFASWLCGIAANVIRNQLRSVRRNGRVEQLDHEPEARGPADSHATTRERAERIALGLARLPDRYEAVLRAKYLDAQSVTEIAAAWHETPKAIESLLTRARQAFREAYLKTEADDGSIE